MLNYVLKIIIILSLIEIFISHEVIIENFNLNYLSILLIDHNTIF